LDQEITEAIGVGKTVRKGAMGKMDHFAATVLEDAKVRTDDAPEAEGCHLT